MKTLLERYEQEAHILKAPLDRLPAHIKENLIRAKQLGLFGPKAGFGPFRQMVDGAIGLCAQTAVTGTTETALWPTAQYTGFGPSVLRLGQCWHLTIAGLITTPASGQGNITLTPRFGTSSSGTALGASAATALTASETSLPWKIEYDLEVRSLGAAGANSTVFGFGEFKSNAISSSVILFSSTAAVSVDLSVTQGLYIGVTLGSASDSMTTESIKMESYN